MKYLILLFLSLFVIQCTKDKPTTLTTENSDTSKVAQKDSIDTNIALISPKDIELQNVPIPNQIKSCNCVFSSSIAALQNGEFLYVDDNAEKAYLKFNGIDQELMLLTTEESEQGISKELENENYRISINAKKTSQNEIYKGVLTIESADGYKKTITIFGKIGC